MPLTEHRYSQFEYDEKGYSFSLTMLKQYFKYGDKVKIKQIEYGSSFVDIPADIEIDSATYHLVDNVYFVTSKHEINSKIEEIFVHYVLDDGKPEKSSLMQLFEVNVIF